MADFESELNMRLVDPDVRNMGKFGFWDLELCRESYAHFCGRSSSQTVIREPLWFGLVFEQEDGGVGTRVQHESCRPMSWLSKETNFIIFGGVMNSNWPISKIPLALLAGGNFGMLLSFEGVKFDRSQLPPIAFC